jgi:chorismate synthase
VTDDIVIRPLSTREEMQACVELQRDTWGRSFTDAIPVTMLQIAQKVGGVAAGAFSGSQLVGFVFGITGVRGGEIVHWSDMLAVRPEVQSRGIGRRLKQFQRMAVAAVGAREILWTYDPLVARNAHLNFNVFGVRVLEYVEDMYGQTGSDLHDGLGTDRLIVGWPVADDELGARRRATGAARSDGRFERAPITGDAGRPDPRSDAAYDGNAVRVAVPSDIHAVLRTDPRAAAEWRRTTRIAFQCAFAGGYQVVGFSLAPDDDRGYYLLSRAT